MGAHVAFQFKYIQRVAEKEIKKRPLLGCKEEVLASSNFCSLVLALLQRKSRGESRLFLFSGRFSGTGGLLSGFAC